ncbi:hypothetical protein [Nocardia nova]|uniref:hypothetical protein n=1 Tax=Nocardia nova TaxID=37330 RepID=UPI0033EAD57E
MAANVPGGGRTECEDGERITPGRARVAELFVVRRAGLPRNVLDDLRAPDTVAVLRELLAVRAAIEVRGRDLSDTLYRIVPTLPDKTTRRKVIGLRRDIRNVRRVESVVAEAHSMAARLGTEFMSQVEAWAELCGTADALWRFAQTSLDTESAGIVADVRRHLAGPVIASGLAWASPAFSRRLESDLDAAVDARSARTATAYLTRIAAKPSPFSTLSTVSVTGTYRRPEIMPPNASHVVTNRSIAVALFLACIAHAAAAKAMDVVRVGGLRQLGDRPHAVLTTRTVRGSVALRFDEITDCGDLDGVLARLPLEPVPLADFTAADDVAQARRLLDIGLLQPVLPWTADCSDDYAALAEWARHKGIADSGDLGTALDDLAAQRSASTTGTPGARRTAIEAATRAAEQVFTALDAPMPAWIPTTPPFHELVAHGPDEPDRLPATISADLSEIARRLAPATGLDPRYERLVRYFVRRHGPGARDVDLLDTLYPVLAHGLGRLPGAPSASVVESAPRLRGHGTVGIASHTVFFQVDRDSDADYRVIVNAVHGGAIGLLARWSVHPQMNAWSAEYLSEWVTSGFPGSTVYQVVPYADWSTLQRPALADLPRIALPGDLPDTSAAADLTRMVVSHDIGTNTLQVVDRQGRSVSFAHLGVVPQPDLTGIPALLCLLSNPWTTLPRGNERSGTRAAADGVVSRPRREQGRIVWARATWVFAAHDVPRARGTRLEFLRDILNWQRARGLPDEVFVTRIEGGGPRARRGKPQWVGFDHPHAIWIAFGELDTSVTSVEVVEALPRMLDHARSAPEYTTEYIGVVRHG